jgi:6-phosphogluconolactonase
MRHACLVLVLVLGACKSDSPKNPRDSGSSGGADGSTAGRGGTGGTGGSSGDAAMRDEPRDESPVDAAMADGARDVVASEPMPGPEAIVRSDATLPANSPYVYIGSSAEIRIYQLDLMTENLVGRDVVPVMGPTGTSIASYMVWDSKKTVMYVTHRVPNPAMAIPDGGVARVAAVTAYSINKTTGGLTKLGDSVGVPNIDGATHIAIHSDKYLYVANYSGNSVSVFGINANGSVGSVIENKTMLASGMAYRMAHQAVVEGNFLLVPCLGLNAVAQFVIDPATGKLSDNTPPLVMVPSMSLPAPDGGAPDGGVADPGAGPRHLALSQDRKYAFVLNELQGTITVFNFDAAKGTLGTVVETVLSSAAGGPRETAAAHPVVNKHILYVSNRRTKSIGVFKIEPATGTLTVVEHELAGGTITFARDFTIDPTGKFLVVANERNVPENVANVLEISPMDGSLTPRQTVGIGQGSQFAGILQLP